MQEEMRSTEIGALVAETEQDTTAAEGDPRVDDLERRIRELEAAIGDLRTVSASAAAAGASSTGTQTGRKTQAAYAPRLLAKGAEPARDAGVDAALGGLSLEQRIAVKAGLLRAGLL